MNKPEFGNIGQIARVALETELADKGSVGATGIVVKRHMEHEDWILAEWSEISMGRWTDTGFYPEGSNSKAYRFDIICRGFEQITEKGYPFSAYTLKIRKENIICLQF